MIAEPYILFQSKDKECAHRQQAPRRTMPLKQRHFHLKVFANLTCDFSFYLFEEYHLISYIILFFQILLLVMIIPFTVSIEHV